MPTRVMVVEMQVRSMPALGVMVVVVVVPRGMIQRRDVGLAVYLHRRVEPQRVPFDRVVSPAARDVGAGRRGPRDIARDADLPRVRGRLLGSHPPETPGPLEDLVAGLSEHGNSRRNASAVGDDREKEAS